VSTKSVKMFVHFHRPTHQTLSFFDDEEKNSFKPVSAPRVNGKYVSKENLYRACQNFRLNICNHCKMNILGSLLTTSGADAINISGLLNPKKLGNFKNRIL